MSVCRIARNDAYFFHQRETQMKQLDIDKILRELETQRFWGSVEIELRDGKPALLRKSETIKFDSMGNNRDAKETRS